MRCRLVIFVIWIKNSCLPYSFHYFVELELDALWFNGAPPINLPGEDDAFLVDSIPSVSFGEPASPPPVLFVLVIFPPVLFWAYTLDTIAGAATRLIDNNAILRATPATILARFLFICLKVNCILYNYCKLLANINQLNIYYYLILPSINLLFSLCIQSLNEDPYLVAFFGLVASSGNVEDFTRFSEKMIVRCETISYTQFFNKMATKVHGPSPCHIFILFRKFLVLKYDQPTSNGE